MSTPGQVKAIKMIDALSSYFQALGRKGGLAGTRADKVRAGRAGARRRWGAGKGDRALISKGRD